MAETRKSRSSLNVAPMEVPMSVGASPALEAAFDPDLVAAMRALIASGLNPSSALDLLARLIAEVPVASKEAMDRIKTADKLINTARAMMETRLKNEETAAIGQRLDALEQLVRRVATEHSSVTVRPLEVWDKPQENE